MSKLNQFFWSFKNILKIVSIFEQISLLRGIVIIQKKQKIYRSKYQTKLISKYKTKFKIEVLSFQNARESHVIRKIRYSSFLKLTH